MAYYKAQKEKSGKYYPYAIVQGKPVSTEEVADELAKRSTVSRADCFAVLKDMGDIIASLMKHGKSVRLEGLGTFRLTIDVKKNSGTDTPEEVGTEQIGGVRVRFTPETRKRSDGTIATRAGIAEGIEWIKLGADTADGGTGGTGGTDGDQGSEPLG